MILLIFPKVPQFSLGILRVRQIPPPLEHPLLKNPTTNCLLMFIVPSVYFFNNWSTVNWVVKSCCSVFFLLKTCALDWW